MVRRVAVLGALAGAVLLLLVPAATPRGAGHVERPIYDKGAISVDFTDMVTILGTAGVSLGWVWDDGLSSLEKASPCGWGTPTYPSSEVRMTDAAGKVWGLFTATGGDGRGSGSAEVPAGHYVVSWRYTARRELPDCRGGGAPAEVKQTTRNGSLDFSIKDSAIQLCRFDATSTSGSVSVRSGAGTRPLHKGDPFGAGQTVRTGPSGTGTFVLADGSMIRIDPSSAVSFADAECKAQHRSLSLKVLLGRLWISLQRTLGSGRDFQVTTENGATGVRGTILEIFVSRTGGIVTTRVHVIEGSVVARSRFGPGAVTVRAGQETVIRGRARPTPPQRFSP